MPAKQAKQTAPTAADLSTVDSTPSVNQSSSGTIGPAMNKGIDQEQRIAGLVEQVSSLTTAVQMMLERNAEKAASDQLFTGLGSQIGELKSLLAVAPVAVGYAGARAAASAPINEGGKDCECGCNDGGCGCVAPGCCCFEIVLDKMRAIQPQAELLDSGGAPGVWNPLDVRIYAAVDSGWGPVGIVYPSLWSTVDLDVGTLLLGGKPGPWTIINQVMNRVYVKKGCTQTFPVILHAIESDSGLAERISGMRDEIGCATSSITLDCCVPNIYPQMPVDISFEYGGAGGGVSGMISVAFSARRVCC
jgi:hypothetical protein